MRQWYQNNRRLFRKEREALAVYSPLMMLSVVGPGFQVSPTLVTKFECAVAHGTHILNTPGIEPDVEYNITLWFPDDYPNSFPIMFCIDDKLPIEMLDRHILSDGQACLEVGPEIRRRWPKGSSITDFIEKLVNPFLAWQVYYDAFGKPPAWGERAHGITGIIDYYAELLGIDEDSNVLGFMELLSRKNQPKGHEPCPCGSCLKLRDCHREELNRAREKTFWADVKMALATCLKPSS